MSHRAISARTTYPNSPETDQQQRVWHTVLVDFGRVKINLLHYSSDPMTAIQEVNAMTDEEVQELEHEA